MSARLGLVPRPNRRPLRIPGPPDADANSASGGRSSGVVGVIEVMLRLDLDRDFRSS